LFSTEWDAYMHKACLIKALKDKESLASMEAEAVADELDLCDQCGEPLKEVEFIQCQRCLDKVFDEIDPTGELCEKAGKVLQHYHDHPHIGEATAEDFEDF
jgi:hypothetical protein